MKKILTKCRRRHYKGATLANEVGLEYNYARKLFAKLVNAGLLRNDPELGYRTVKP
jgi:DNA-binding IscR family transcriptional regulator